MPHQHIFSLHLTLLYFIFKLAVLENYKLATQVTILFLILLESASLLSDAGGLA